MAPSLAHVFYVCVKRQGLQRKAPTLFVAWDLQRKARPGAQIKGRLRFFPVMSDHFIFQFPQFISP